MSSELWGMGVKHGVFQQRLTRVVLLVQDHQQHLTCRVQLSESVSCRFVKQVESSMILHIMYIYFLYISYIYIYILYIRLIIWFVQQLILLYLQVTTESCLSSSNSQISSNHEDLQTPRLWQRSQCVDFCLKTVPNLDETRCHVSVSTFRGIFPEWNAAGCNPNLKRFMNLCYVYYIKLYIMHTQMYEHVYIYICFIHHCIIQTWKIKWQNVPIHFGFPSCASLMLRSKPERKKSHTEHDKICFEMRQRNWKTTPFFSRQLQLWCTAHHVRYLNLKKTSDSDCVASLLQEKEQHHPSETCKQHRLLLSWHGWCE